MFCKPYHKCPGIADFCQLMDPVTLRARVRSKQLGILSKGLIEAPIVHIFIPPRVAQKWAARTLHSQTEKAETKTRKPAFVFTGGSGGT